MKWSDIFRRKLVRNILLLIPGIIADTVVNALVKQDTVTYSILNRLITIYITAVIVMIIVSALRAASEHLGRNSKYRGIPLKGIFQALQILAYFIGGLIVIAVLLNRSPAMLLTGLGASAAVLMLIFKDSILGFVAGIQLSQNKMIQLGDWIQLPDGSANGTVEEITLNTVKVRNWDNTLSMVPPYTLVSAPFKNWRGMQESGGRRADKMIYIDVNSLEECTQEMVDDMVKSFPLLKGLVPGSQENPVTGATTTAGASTGDRLTNAQVYRTYISAYLKQHPYVNPSLDIIITQKEATPYGMPIEVYFFTREKDWALYEKQQSDIFDHLMSIAPEFGLRLYQRP